MSSNRTESTDSEVVSKGNVRETTEQGTSNHDDDPTIEQIHTQISENFRFIDDELQLEDEQQVTTAPEELPDGNSDNGIGNYDSIIEAMNTEISQMNQLSNKDDQRTVEEATEVGHFVTAEDSEEKDTR